MAVPVTVSLAKTTGDVAEDQPFSRTDFLLNPEFKAPASTAVAAVPGGDSAEREWIYSRDQSETMHPFWAVRRITDTALQQEKDQVTMQIKKTGESLRISDFNFELVTQVHTDVHIAIVGGQNLTSTTFVHAPYICNVKDVVEGEELIVRHVVRAKTKKVEKQSLARCRQAGGGEEEQTKETEAMTAVAAAFVIIV
jgi:hypothetical protein